MGVQLFFTPHMCYGLSVAVKWYILVRLWRELSVEKHQLGAKATKMATK